MNPYVHIKDKEYVYKELFKLKASLKQDFQSQAVAPFIGRFGYPNVYVGVLSPIESRIPADECDAPKVWSGKGATIESIASIRANLLNSRFQSNIKIHPKLIDIAKEAGMAKSPFDVDFHLKEKPKLAFSFNTFAAPTGPRADLTTATITSNPKVSSKVEKVVADIDLKANDAMVYLYQKGFDENFISRLLSVGNMGIKFDRRLVPTRWSITASDDSIGKHLLDDIRDFDHIGYQAHFGGILGNHFLFLFFPGSWSYELFEITTGQDRIQFSTDHEFFQGRRSYAQETSGGYYACRIAVAEYLKRARRQGFILALRFITPEYRMPLGVWVVREASRRSLSSPPISFTSESELLSYARDICNSYGVDLDFFLKSSIVRKELQSQRTLAAFGFS